jgi:hypothetical protein
MRVKPRKRSSLPTMRDSGSLLRGPTPRSRWSVRSMVFLLSTFYRWRASVATHKSEEGARLNHLESENRRLKRQVAELWLDYTSLRNALINGKGREC